MEGETKRILYLDALRVIAIAGVIIIHVSAEMGAETDWKAFVTYNCLGRFAVPVFFMISGCIFLNPRKEYGVKKLYAGNIARLVRIFLFWSVLYAVRDMLCGLNDLSQPFRQVLENFIKGVILGPTHFWFLAVMIALYMITPFLRLIAAEKRLTEYFLILWIIFTMLPAFTNPVDQLTIVRDFFENFEMRFVVGYSGYFLLGHYIHTWFKPDKKQRYIIYIAGILAYFFTVAVTDRLSLQKGDYVETYLNGDMFNCFLMALAVFILIKEICEKKWIKEGLQRKIFRIAECSFGIYLVHMLSFNLIDYGKIAGKITASAVEIPGFALFVYAGSYIAVRLIMKIPAVGKKLV